MPPILRPQILPAPEPGVDEIARAKTKGIVYASAIKELEELWADEEGPMYLDPRHVSLRAIRAVSVFEVKERSSFETIRNLPVKIHGREIDAFLEGFCEVLPGAYPEELPTPREEAFIAKHAVINDQATGIRSRHRGTVRKIEQGIAASLEATRSYAQSMQMLFGAAFEPRIEDADYARLKAY